MPTLASIAAQYRPSNATPPPELEPMEPLPQQQQQPGPQPPMWMLQPPGGQLAPPGTGPTGAGPPLLGPPGMGPQGPGPLALGQPLGPPLLVAPPGGVVPNGMGPPNGFGPGPLGALTGPGPLPQLAAPPVVISLKPVDPRAARRVSGLGMREGCWEWCVRVRVGCGL